VIPITFVVPVNNEAVFTGNLLSSPCLSEQHAHEVLVQRGFSSAAHAYNDAIGRAANDILVFVHQDVYFPRSWMSDLEATLSQLDQTDPFWGVLGCWGVTTVGQEQGYLFTTHWGVIGQHLDAPRRVRTLDEVVLICRRSSGLLFDPTLPHYHFYGTDICLRAEASGMANYAISTFCVHNTTQLSYYPREFYECYRHIKTTWRDRLPIHTPCITVSRYDAFVWLRRLRQLRVLLLGRLPPRTPRARQIDDVLIELRHKGFLSSD
jgi:Glycosyltransferase like family